MLSTTELVVLIAIIQNCLGFLPEIQMPYILVSGGGSEIGIIGTTLTCNEQRNSTKVCATDCYDREQSGTGCPGFYTDPTLGNTCHLCHASNLTEAQGSEHNTFTSNQKVYLLLTNPVIPEISMDFDNYTGNTIYGKNTVGTINGAANHVAGRKNEGFYFNGNKVALTGLEEECWTNLDHCTSGVTISIWFKPKVIKQSYAVSTGSIDVKGIGFLMEASGQLKTFVTLNSGWFHSASTTALVANQWYLLTGLYHHVTGIKTYIDGQYETSRPPSAAFATGTNSHVDWGANVGLRLAAAESGAIDGYLDELKYYYRLLNPTGMYFLR